MDEATITASLNGPYLVSGPVHLTEPDGREIPHPAQFAMCRRGRSSNKPFCDGTHLTFGFDRTLAD
ncbi:MAG: CDGSH iron-sulfur domain-containing protein [Chloroflexi bacterium]|nr:CDGSH iron-sulfur domain-containing protein [Chloroflexota bacterium]